MCLFALLTSQVRESIPPSSLYAKYSLAQRPWVTGKCKCGCLLGVYKIKCTTNNIQERPGWNICLFRREKVSPESPNFVQFLHFSFCTGFILLLTFLINSLPLLQFFTQLDVSMFSCYYKCIIQAWERCRLPDPTSGQYKWNSWFPKTRCSFSTSPVYVEKIPYNRVTLVAVVGVKSLPAWAAVRLRMQRKRRSAHLPVRHRVRGPVETTHHLGFGFFASYS